MNILGNIFGNTADKSGLAMAAMLAIGVIAVISLLLAMAARKGGGGRHAPRFKARLLLTPSEAEFLARLEAAVPEYRFHCQVAMGALLEPDIARKGNGRDYFRMRAMVSQKVVDYVAQRRDNGQIVAIIELDDRSHDAAKDARRDAMLHQAGYRTLRWQASARPGAAEILAALVPPPVTVATAAITTPAANGVRAEIWQRPPGKLN